MLAQVAEHLYWLSRYVERAEATARLAIAASDTILDLPDGVPYDWESLMQVFGSGDSDPGISEAEVMEEFISLTLVALPHFPGDKRCFSRLVSTSSCFFILPSNTSIKFSLFLQDS